MCNEEETLSFVSSLLHIAVYPPFVTIQGDFRFVESEIKQITVLVVQISVLFATAAAATLLLY